jgi:hypothetical protein
MIDVATTPRGRRFELVAVVAMVAAAVAAAVLAFRGPRAIATPAAHHPLHLGGTIFARVALLSEWRDNMHDCPVDHYVMAIVDPLPGDPATIDLVESCDWGHERAPHATEEIEIDPRAGYAVHVSALERLIALWRLG